MRCVCLLRKGAWHSSFLFLEFGNHPQAVVVDFNQILFVVGAMGGGVFVTWVFPMVD